MAHQLVADKPWYGHVILQTRQTACPKMSWLSLLASMVAQCSLSVWRTSKELYATETEPSPRGVSGPSYADGPFPNIYGASATKVSMHKMPGVN